MMRCSTCRASEAVVMACWPGSEPVEILGFPIEPGELRRDYCWTCWLSRFGDGQATGVQAAGLPARVLP